MTRSRIARKRSIGTCQLAPCGPNHDSVLASQTIDDAWQVDKL